MMLTISKKDKKMMNSTKRILLKKNGYDPFIDFLKGLCIIFVVLDHCFLVIGAKKYVLFHVWGSPAVPIFLILQVFHSYKKGLDNIKTNYYKLWKRIIKPFILVQLVIVILSLCMAADNSDEIKQIPKNIVKYGGLGSGSYFPWVYVQFAIVLPIIVPLFKKIKGISLAVVFILLSEFFEIIFCVLKLPDFVWRLSFFRYTLLFYLGYILATKGYILNRRNILISIISIASVVVFVYTDINMSPFIYGKSWKTIHWICYFYIAYFLFYLFKLLYTWVQHHIIKFLEYVKKIGCYSYEIFLVQMVYFDFHRHVINAFSGQINNIYIVHLLAISFAIIICIVPVLVYKERRLLKNS